MTSIIKVNTIQDVGGNNLLISNGSGSITTNNIAGNNTPAFHVNKTDSTSCSANSATKITFTEEYFDTNNAFADSKFVVPSGEDGKYYIYFHVSQATLEDNKYVSAYIYKNGSMYVRVINYGSGSNSNQYTSGIALMNLSASDYIEIYVKQNSSGSQNISGESGEPRTWFGGFKLIGA